MRLRMLVVTAAVASGPVLAPVAAHATTIVEEGVTATIRCEAGNRTVRVDGAQAHLTILGRCRSITVNGAQARIAAHTVDRIVVNGAESHVRYRRSSTGGRAAVSVLGADSSVTRRR